jgi:hypothetical protein
MEDKDLAMITFHVGVTGSSNAEQFMTDAYYQGKLESYLYARRHFASVEPEEDSYRLVEIKFPSLASSVDDSVLPPIPRIDKDYPPPGKAKNYFGGVPDIPTDYGDCGGILVSIMGSNNAPVIMGFHTVAITPGLTGSLFGAKVSSYSTMILQSDLAKLHKVHEQQAQFQSAFVQMPINCLPDYRNCVDKTPLDVESDIHYKSAFNFFPELKDGDPNVRFFSEVVGGLKGFRRSTTSAIRRSPIYDTLVEEFGITTNKVVPPKIQEWKPQRIFLEELSTEAMTGHPNHVIHVAANSYLAKILEILPDSLAPITIDQAVNGIPDTQFIDAINQKTSGGFGLEGPKRNLIQDEYLVEVNGRIEINIKYKPEIYAEVEEYRKSYLQGQRHPAIFSAVNKDELLSQEKASKGKFRQIFTSPLPFTILVRQYLMTFIAAIQTSRTVSECAVGLNAMSLQWRGLRKYLIAHGEDTCFDGDYKGFDKGVISGNVLYAVLDVIYRAVAPRLPTDDDRTILAGILSEMGNPLVDFHGTLAVFNMNPSGNPITVVINCIGNSIIARVIWCLLHPSINLMHAISAMYDIDDPDQRRMACQMILVKIYNTPADSFEQVVPLFDLWVRLITYGDDNVFNVSKKAPWFNHTLFAAAAHVLGIEYTHADKSDPRLVRVDYKHISEITFLKRSFVHDADLNVTYAPLDKASFATMVLYNTKNPIKTQMELSASSIQSWIWESGQHGREYYDEVQAIVGRLAEIHPELSHRINRGADGQAYFKTYDEILEACYGQMVHK